jgi:hypothetical protein
MEIERFRAAGLPFGLLAERARLGETVLPKPIDSRSRIIDICRSRPRDRPHEHGQ